MNFFPGLSASFSPEGFSCLAVAPVTASGSDWASAWRPMEERASANTVKIVFVFIFRLFIFEVQK